MLIIGPVRPKVGRVMCFADHTHPEADADAAQLEKHPLMSGWNCAMLGTLVAELDDARRNGLTPRSSNCYSTKHGCFVIVKPLLSRAGQMQAICIADDRKDSAGNPCLNLVAIDFGDPTWFVNSDPYAVAANRAL